ncbi:hypothetical protein EW146_g732 [Bondarzewia mesenterica]|uniref:Uncharacterized protein n=1 Tax=Bondarzewia mesenterica TaxID=1095465 RepID=A0A4S4M625_9AGAM|nr:hypothetical protein EW146_g732 [Bondarzewia mesenterica]
MENDIELDDLSHPKASDYDSNSGDTPQRPDDDADDAKGGTLASWSWAAASILGIWSTLLMFFPRVLLFAAEETQRLTPLESFLALHFGIFLAGTAIALITNIPFAQPVPQSTDDVSPTHPLLVPLTAASLLSAFLSYNTRNAGGLPVVFALCTGTIGIWGLWTVSTTLSLLSPNHAHH